MKEERLMEDLFAAYPKLSSNYEEVIAQWKGCDAKKLFKSEVEIKDFIIGVMDYTTLEGSDNSQTISMFCEKALNIRENTVMPAALCVYPVFVELVKRLTANSNIVVASVAGAFPSAQLPLSLRIAEVKYALQEGADEIDIAISRGRFLEGDLAYVFNEIKAIKNECEEKNGILKVILEVGELRLPNSIYQASILALEAGADFIKTSTGKIPVGATFESVWLMLWAIKAYYQKTGVRKGIKIAGGVATYEDAVTYISLVNNVLGKEWLDKKLFRIGASRLIDRLS